jgi:hypothetical protein
LQARLTLGLVVVVDPHSHSCAPNSALQKWTVGGEPHIMLVSLRWVTGDSPLAGPRTHGTYEYAWTCSPGS